MAMEMEMLHLLNDYRVWYSYHGDDKEYFLAVRDYTPKSAIQQAETILDSEDGTESDNRITLRVEKVR